jgi:hypothetical protein
LKAIAGLKLKGRELRDPEPNIDDWEDEPASDDLEDAPASLASFEHEENQELPDDKDHRPNLGKKADVIQFGVRCKRFYGMDFNKGTFTMDLVLTLRWNDARIKRLVPKDKKSVVLATASAEKQMWLPDVFITNRGLGGVEVLSASVALRQDGRVTQTERMLVVLENRFDVSAFPFDVQTLQIRVGSATLMADELQLEALHGGDVKELTGVVDDLFDHASDFKLESVSLRTFEDRDGSLTKSRGELAIVVDRNSYPLIERLMIPELLLLAINWSAFFFPLLKQFIMPRISACLLSFLMLLTLSLRTSRLLPQERSGFVWIEIFEECVETLMFFTICLHILIEAIYHQWSCVQLASRMAHELKLLFLVQCAIVFGFTALYTSGEHLADMAITIRFLLFGSSFAYIIWGLKRAHDWTGEPLSSWFMSPQEEQEEKS